MANVPEQTGFAPLGTPTTYEWLLSQNSEWAMSEGSVFFEGRGRVQESLRRITKRLSELGVPYAVAGGMALFYHGFRRFTEDVDILVTAEGLKQIHDECDGRGYVRPFETSKNLRDTDTRVKIEFLITGQFPGDGKPKPFAFPNPASVAELRGGVQVVNLPTLLALKLASGMSAPDRIKDLADVEELIKTLDLPEQLATSLDPYVRDKYLEIWYRLEMSSRRFVKLVALPVGTDVESIEDLLARFPQEAPLFKSMLADGVELDLQVHGGEYRFLTTNRRSVARKYQMIEESELDF